MVGFETGTIYPTSKWGDVRILKYTNHKNVLVEFLETGYQRTARSELILRGICEDITQPSVFNKGIFGEGPYSKKTHLKEYQLWMGLINRTYCGDFHVKYPTCVGTTVSENWHNFQEFAEWCQWQKGFKNTQWELDKDLLSFNSKVYSSETCCFIPKALNIALQINCSRDILPGVYKTDSGYRVTIGSGCTKESKRFKCEVDAFMWYYEKKDRLMKQYAYEYANELDERALDCLLNFKTIERLSVG
ncbi:hypothetical protein D3C85_715520 [compost metagenome]